MVPEPTRGEFWAQRELGVNPECHRCDPKNLKKDDKQSVLLLHNAYDLNDFWGLNMIYLITKFQR